MYRNVNGRRRFLLYSRDFVKTGLAISGLYCTLFVQFVYLVAFEGSHIEEVV